MRILQPADWPKPRGFSHGVTLDGPGQWIVLAGQTGGDEKGDYQPDMAGQVGTGARIANLRVKVRSRWSDLLVTGLTLGLVVPRSVTFEGVVAGK